MLRRFSYVFAAALALGAGSAEADNWRELAPLESARSEARAAVVDGEIYVAGGATLSGPSDVFEAYDPRSNHWLPLESMPEGRDSFGMAARGSLIYIGGGFSSFRKNKPSAGVYAFDTATGIWSSRADMPEPRVGHTLTAVGDNLYAIGGNGAGADRVLRYDTRTDKWAPFGAAIPVQRTGHAAAAFGNKIYLVGGRSSSGVILSRVDVFDAASGQWSTAAHLPVAVVGSTADFLGNELHVAGGTASSLKRTLNDHYALSGGAWRKLASMPTARQGLTSAAVDGRWFLIGGGAGSGALAVFTETDAVEVYTP